MRIFPIAKLHKSLKPLPVSFIPHKTYRQGVQIPYNAEVLTQQTASAENTGLNVQNDLIKEPEKIQKGIIANLP
jgi:hypothetical protein